MITQDDMHASLHLPRPKKMNHENTLKKGKTMKQHYTVTIDEIIEEHHLYTDCEGADKYSHLRQCLIVTKEEEDHFVCGFFPMDTPYERINQAMKIIFGEKAFKEMDLMPIPQMWTPQAWPVIRDWMAQNDYSSAESIAALV